MNRPALTVLILIFLGISSWAQETKAPFDVKKSREELEIMKGILSTTLTFVARSSHDSSARWRFPNIDAFYLASQGAVFVIPTSTIRILINSPQSSNEYFSSEMAEEISRYSQAIAQEAMGAAAEGLRQSGFADSMVPQPAQPPGTQQQNRERVEVDREELRKRVEEFQARAKKSREEAEARRQKLLEVLSQIRIHLVEALANYGDSITTVKPDEFINLVLVTDDLENRGKRSDIISAQKSWITDYKSGKLSLEGFKQKALQYVQ